MNHPPLDSTFTIARLTEIHHHLDVTSHFLFYDIILEKLYPQFIQGFPHRLALRAGESLKDFQQVEALVTHLMSQDLKAGCGFIAFGGGSIGDLVGFIASIWKRGAPYQIIPSTWLALLDSAHGGKNALNWKGVKNQLGSFYFPSRVWIAQEIMDQLPETRAQEAWAEALKVALIDSQELYQKLITQNSMSSLIHDLIQAKLKIVAKDPWEKIGPRRWLNLGHTLGHVFESFYQWPHGQAVAYGLRFSYEWSGERSLRTQDFPLPGIPTRSSLQQALPPAIEIENRLRMDKKQEGQGLHFVFIRQPGEVFTEKVQLQEILNYIEQIRD